MLTLEDVRGMSGEEINERWEEVKEALRAAGDGGQDVGFFEELDVETVRRMTPAQIVERWDEVAAVLASLKGDQNDG